MYCTSTPTFEGPVKAFNSANATFLSKAFHGFYILYKNTEAFIIIFFLFFCFSFFLFVNCFVAMDNFLLFNFKKKHVYKSWIFNLSWCIPILSIHCMHHSFFLLTRKIVLHAPIFSLSSDVLELDHGTSMRWCTVNVARIE